MRRKTQKQADHLDLALELSSIAAEHLVKSSEPALAMRLLSLANEIKTIKTNADVEQARAMPANH